MKKKITNAIPFFQKLKWGPKIFDLLLINGAMNLKDIKKELSCDNKKGKTISYKVLLETLNKMEKEQIIVKIPSNERTPSYDLTKNFRTKEFNQIIQLNNIKNQGFYTDTINFQHTIYGLPEFEKIKGDDQNHVLDLIGQIDDALYGLNEIKQRTNSDTTMGEIVLLSTPPVNRSKMVLENIELMLNVTIKDSIFVGERYEDKLALGNIRRYADIIQSGIICQNGKWVKNLLSEKKFKYHKLFKKYYSEADINFMFTVIKEIVNNKNNVELIRWSELEKLVIYKGFQQPNDSFSGGIWYNEDNKPFYMIAEHIIKKIDEKDFSKLSKTRRIKLIIEHIKSRSILKNIEINYQHLALYIEAKIYFEKTRNVIPYGRNLFNINKKNEKK